MQAAGHNIACTGFIPVPQPDDPWSPTSSLSHADPGQAPTIDISTQLASERAFSPPVRLSSLDGAGPYIS